MEDTDLLFTLLAKIAVIASMASIALRSNFAKRLFLSERRSIRQRFQLATLFGSVFASGTCVRLTLGYRAADVGLEGAFVSGLVGGYVPGTVTGLCVAFPAIVLAPSHEWAGLPLLVGVGALGGLLRALAPDPEDVWRFSPFFLFSILAWARRSVPPSRGAFQAALLACCVGIEFIRTSIAHSFERQGLLFSLYGPDAELHPLTVALAYVATVMGIGLTLKVWNDTRNEWKIENQQRLLAEARLMNLTRQINPHFLFNTLNSVASLIRTNPEQARQMIYRLSAILRRLLRKQDAFVPLRDEVSMVDDYLQIELVRFAGRLRIEKNIEPGTAEALIPNMVLQPIIENSIKHGIGPKVGQGTIRLNTALRSGRVQIEVEDDGVGIPHEQMPEVFQKGVGLSNVHERLLVLFGNDFRFTVEPREGGGVRVRVQIPELRELANRSGGQPDPAGAGRPVEAGAT